MKAPEVISVLVLEPGQDRATLRTVTPDVTAFQNLVGGWVQVLGLGAGASLCLNEDGKAIGLPVNGAANRLLYLADPGLHPADYVVGTVVVVGEESVPGPGTRWVDVSTEVLTLCARAGVEVGVVR